MATEVIKIVDPGNASGTDYTSLNSFESGEQRDLVTANEIAVAECRSSNGAVDTTAVTFAGWTTDADHYIEVRNHSSEPPNGYYDTNRYRLESTTAWANSIRIQESVRIKNIQIGYNAANAYMGIRVDVTKDSTCYVVGNIIWNKSGNGIRGIYLGGGTGIRTQYVYNNIVYDFATFGIHMYSVSGTHITYIYNNTVYNCNVGFYCSDYPGTSPSENKNNISSNNSTSDFAFHNHTGDRFSYNCSSDYTADDYGSGTGDIVNHSVNFLDSANDKFLLNRNLEIEVRGAGTDLSAVFDVDVLNNKRKLNQWDMGAHQITLRRITIV